MNITYITSSFPLLEHTLYVMSVIYILDFRNVLELRERMPFKPLRELKPDLFIDERVTDEEDVGDEGSLSTSRIELFFFLKKGFKDTFCKRC